MNRVYLVANSSKANRLDDLSFTYKEMEFGTYFKSANPYSNNRSLKLDNTNIVRGRPEFENALIGRNIRAGNEIKLSNEAISKATELIDSIDTYLNE